ncbi:energy transducer TonB [Shewanella ulleungensis]|jgi:protein TonB|uniref:Protein TonB n=1 Tax=Shewanella ulleungensis TaxID=2282699 RepID=A0ABQ2QF32_9GAMM|nr:energy transducer TonB [Shewanella ulleungensis]MCL1149452.1 TonB family protein [Shewanella ulleungensis]GGP79192.1 protein TonB [Shewanella ulleungensis]
MNSNSLLGRQDDLFHTGVIKTERLFNYQKWLSQTAIVIIGAVVTLGLFVFMSQLVKNDHVLTGEASDAPLVNVVQDIPKPVAPRTIERLKPKPIIPNVERVAIPTSAGGEVTMIANELILPVVQTGSETYERGGNSSDALPVVQVAPQYPIIAARDGIEGYVVVEFDINEMGAVMNAKVIDAQPRRTFDRSAIQAIKGWKYKPKLDQGHAVSQYRQQVRLDFSLEKSN